MDDEDQRPSLLKGFAEMRGDMVERANKARVEGARPIIGADSSPDDIRAAFRRRGVLEPRDIAPAVQATVVSALPDGRRWFILQTKPQAEAVAVRALTEQQIACCAPEIADWVTRSRQEHIRIRPLFPRYVFVGLSPDNRGDLDFRTARLCDGAAGFVQAAGGMAEVRDTAVGDLMFANERRWIDFIWSRASKERPRKGKSFAARDFAVTMQAVLEASPTRRLDLFLQRYGKRGNLLHADAVSDTAEA